jgi:predicted protein tyrosine phosphatase
MEAFQVDPINAIQDVPGLYISEYLFSVFLYLPDARANLSSITVPRSAERIREHEITHIVSLTNQRDRPNIPEESGVRQLHVEIEDNPFEDLLMVLDAVCAWVDDAFSLGTGLSGSTDDGVEIGRGKNADDATERLDPSAGAPRKPKVLVHCVQGISRSGAVVVAYLMRTCSLDYDSALASARASRSAITPNSGFADQLRLWQRLRYSIFVADPKEKGSTGWGTKPEYEAWRANRGVLLSRGEEEKQRVVRKSMADMAASFGKRRLELKGKKQT